MLRETPLDRARILAAALVLAVCLLPAASVATAVAAAEKADGATSAEGEEARLVRDQIAYVDLLARADAHLAAGNADSAIESLEEAMALEVPDSTLPQANVRTRNAAAFYGLACAFAAKGDLDGARRHLRDAGRNGYRDTARVKSDPRLAPVRALDGFDRLLENFPPEEPTDDYAGKTVSDARFGMGMQMARRGNFPKLGERAPDFELERLHGNGETLRLSSFRGETPVVLVFGSFT